MLCSDPMTLLRANGSAISPISLLPIITMVIVDFKLFKERSIKSKEQRREYMGK